MLTWDRGDWQWVPEGTWFFKRWRLRHPKIATSWKLTSGEYTDLMAYQAHAPVAVAHVQRRTYWMFRDEYYWEEEGLTEEEVQALLLDRERRKQRRIDGALSRMRMDALPPSPSRAPIPDEVKLFVWQRDRGRCVRCGRQTSLEFDHIIPLAMGGSNTERNLQLLCESCNRQKGASLV